MPTKFQLVKRTCRTKRRRCFPVPGLKDYIGNIVRFNPQKKGICTKILTQTPRKPNSAIRKIARVKLCNQKRITIYIGGIGHNLRVYSNVLVRGGGARDLPSSKYSAVRGKYDFARLGSDVRSNARSKYGTKRLFKAATKQQRVLRHK